MKYKINAPPPTVGELVYHLLYGKEWVGVLLEIKEDPDRVDQSPPYTIGLVNMVPNKKYDKHFKTALTRYRISDNMGYISMKWLRSFVAT